MELKDLSLSQRCNLFAGHYYPISKSGLLPGSPDFKCPQTTVNHLLILIQNSVLEKKNACFFFFNHNES